MGEGLGASNNTEVGRGSNNNFETAGQAVAKDRPQLVNRGIISFAIYLNDGRESQKPLNRGPLYCGKGARALY